MVFMKNSKTMWHIKFYLATDRTNCIPSSITHHKLKGQTHIDSNNLRDNEMLRNTSYADPDKYLNIWVTPVKNRGGFEMNFLVGEGAVIDYNHFRNGNTVQFTTVHEIGHVLNLNHIWGGNRIEFFNRNCFVDDGVSDTPRQKKQNGYGIDNAASAQPACDLE